MLLLLGHDLRSPLTALTQTAEQIRTQAGDPAGGFAGEVAGAGRQLLLLIEDIVLWARLRAGVKSSSTTGDVTLLVEPAVRLHAPLATRRGVAVVLDVPAGLAVQTDFVLAQALVRNLVGNAVKFARSGVRIAARRDGKQVVLTVTDDGPGLPPEVAAQLQGGPVAEGRGLGLRLCREISTVLGAALAGPPRPGGAELSVRLPVAGTEVAP